MKTESAKTRRATKDPDEAEGRPARKGATGAASKGVPRSRAPKEKPAPFTGFPKDFFAFFRELAKNNDREWFAANKTRFQQSVQAPMVSFIAAMDLPLGRISDSFIADARPNGGSMFRIYRDTRFSRDKSPYKEHAACHFRHEAGKDAHAPGFYVHLEPKQVFFGGGLWLPPGPELRKVREAIVEDPETWTEITRDRAFRRRFGEVKGDSLKRAPQGFDPEHPLVEDLKKTSFFVLQEVKPELILSKDFVREVTKCFAAMSPFMKFLTSAVGVTFRED